MAYSTPTTAVSGNVLTAAIWNASVRDNFAESSVANCTVAGDVPYADGANSMTRRAIGTAPAIFAVGTGSTAPIWRDISGHNPASTSTTTSTSFTDLDAGANPVISAMTTGTNAIVGLSFTGENSSAEARVIMGYAVSGDSTIAASDARATGDGRGAAAPMHLSGVFLQSGLTAGSNTFTAKYRVSSGTGTFTDRRLWVMAL